MRAQDLLYTVVELSPEGGGTSVPGVHSDAYVAAPDPRRLVRDIAAAGTRGVADDGLPAGAPGAGGRLPG